MGVHDADLRQSAARQGDHSPQPHSQCILLHHGFQQHPDPGPGVREAVIASARKRMLLTWLNVRKSPDGLMDRKVQVCECSPVRQSVPTRRFAISCLRPLLPPPSLALEHGCDFSCFSEEGHKEREGWQGAKADHGSNAVSSEKQVYS